jgi:prepilin-type N-terminal cleavage/methylation domain-containing protein
MIARRGGFTMIELIIVTVLGSLVLLASLQILITQQRTYTAQNVAINGQQSTRMSLEILSNELRELSPEGGDILSMSSTGLQVRLMRKFSIVCGVVFGANPQVLVIRSLIGATPFAVNDSVFVWADNEVETESDDHWIPAEVTAVSSGATDICVEPLLPVTQATRLTFGGQGANFNVTTDSVTMGAPVRSYERFSFGLTTYNGDVYLGRRQAAAAWIPMAGPLRPTDGLGFVYLDSLDAVTATPAEVRQIEVDIRASTRGVTNSVGNLVTDSIAARIFTRN